MGPVLVLLPHQCKLSLIIRKIVYAQNARELIKYKKSVLFGYSLARVPAHGTRHGGMLIDRMM
jgi:hypothetical protein